MPIYLIIESREVELYKKRFLCRNRKNSNEKGIELPDTSWKIEIDVSGTITINGDITEENKEQIKNMISENFADDMWENIFRQQIFLTHNID